MASIEPQSPRLGRLADTARGKHLTHARRVLIGVGILTAVFNLGITVLLKDRVPNQLLGDFAQGALIAMGILFIIFGLFIKQYPVAITVSSLAIFLGMIAILAVLDPTTLAQGWLMKIIVVAALVKALQAALAAQREQSMPLAAADFET